MNTYHIRKPPKEPNYIYLIKNGEHHKVGITSDIKKRMATFRTGSPTPYQLVTYYRCSSARKVEQELHTFLDKYHVKGEWFKLPSELESDIGWFFSPALQLQNR